MKHLKSILFVMCMLNMFVVLAQWKPDSVLNFVAFGDNSVIASIEYFKYNEKDSLVESNLVELNNNQKIPIHKHTYQYAKAKGGIAKIITILSYNSESKTYYPSFETTKLMNKTGRILSETNVSFQKDGSKINENKVLYSYNESGKITRSEFYRWNKQKAIWFIESTVDFKYSENFEEVLFCEFDSISNKLIPQTRTEIFYNSNKTLNESIKYNFNKHTWMPVERSVYGYDTTLNIEGNIVQKFSLEKCGWENVFYYVKKKNKNNLVDTEIHMHWGDKDWLVDLTYYYEYNEQGDLLRLLNENKEILISRHGQIR